MAGCTSLLPKRVIDENQVDRIIWVAGVDVIPGGLIPTALAVDSFWDSQIRESLTRCRLLRGAASMGAAVSITRLDVMAAELRMAAGREKDGSTPLWAGGSFGAF